MRTHLFKLKCLTDLHVGNGEANYSIIDNEVQKDTVLADVPIINGSGVKGALKEHFEQIWGITDKRIAEIFGDENGAGSYKFFTAMCIARPLRVSDGDRPYVLTTSSAILDNFSSFLKGMGLSGFYSKGRAGDELVGCGNIEVEGYPVILVNCEKLKKLIGEGFAVIDNLREFDLPILARNVLDGNGISKNLWYEEVVPHESVFYFAVITPDDDCKLEFEEDRHVQFGGNASVGNGYCTVTEVFSA